MGLTPLWLAAPYTAALSTPLATARGPLRARQGWYVAVRAFGATGLGEVVPEPVWGTESRDVAAAALEALAAGRAAERVSVSRGEVTNPEQGLASLEAWLAASGVSARTHPALHAGLELALLDALARALNVPLAVLLSNGRPPLASLPTAALVGALPPESAAHEAARAVAAGHRTVKLKLDGRDDLARARAVRAAVGPAVALRLDANALWPDVDTAAEALAAFAPLAPEFLEQPVGGLEPLAALQLRVPFPLAADEALIDPDACDRALAAGLRVLVLKPLWRGGLLAARALAARAQAAGARVVLSSALDRGVGTAGVLHLAATLSAPGCVGLGTAGLFEDGGALEGLVPAGGKLDLPVMPGLGALIRDPVLRHIAEVAS